MAVRIIRKWWWVDFRSNHVRYRRRSPHNSKDGARAYEVVLRYRLARGEDIGFHEEKLCPPTLTAFAQTWFENYVIPNNKYSERISKKNALSGSLLPFFGNMRVDKIGLRHIEEYKAYLARTGLSNQTINNRLMILSKCLRTAYEWLELEGFPPRIKKLKVPPVKTDYLTEDEASRLLAHSEGLTHEALLVSLRTGLRQGELKGLQWDAIDWENRTLTVRHSWGDLAKTLEAPKSNRARVIPLNTEVYDALSKRHEAQGFVFLNMKGRPFTTITLNARLSEVCERAGLRRITWHALRHTFATHLAMKGVPLGTVQALLGHSTITITMRYAHVYASALTDAVSLLGSADHARSNRGQPVGAQMQAEAA